MIEEIAKQDSIRVKITWTTGGVKTEAEFDATAVEWKRDDYRTDRSLWTLTLVQQPRMVNREEITVVNNTPPPRNPNPPTGVVDYPFVPATCCGHQQHVGFRCSRCACDGPAMSEGRYQHGPFRLPNPRDAFPALFAGAPVGNHEPRITTIPFDPETHYRDGAGIVRRREIRRTEP